MITLKPRLVTVVLVLVISTAVTMQAAYGDRHQQDRARSKTAGDNRAGHPAAKPSALWSAYPLNPKRSAPSRGSSRSTHSTPSERDIDSVGASQGKNRARGPGPSRLPFYVVLLGAGAVVLTVIGVFGLWPKERHVSYLLVRRRQYPSAEGFHPRAAEWLEAEQEPDPMSRRTTSSRTDTAPTDVLEELERLSRELSRRPPRPLQPTEEPQSGPMRKQDSSGSPPQ